MDTALGAGTTGAGGEFMTDYYRSYKIVKKFLDNHGGSDYWARQIPVVGSVMRSADDARYWDDYKKNTGKTPRYPGRTYSDTLSGVSHSEGSLLKSMKKIYG